jgi:N-methylhydantoinase A
VLLVTGGGGPVHGYQVAKKLGLTRMICPPSAGVASAFGLITAPARVDRVATVGLKLDQVDLESLEARFRALEDEAFATLERTGARRGDAILERNADGRFVGQGFFLSVELPRGPYADRAVLRAAFEKGYREKFTHTPPQVTVEFVNIRVTATAPAPAQSPGMHTTNATARAVAPATRKVYFKEAGGKVDTAVYRRENLIAGFTATGPLLVEEDGSTLVVAPGGRVTLAANGNLVVEIK